MAAERDKSRDHDDRRHHYDEHDFESHEALAPPTVVGRPGADVGEPDGVGRVAQPEGEMKVRESGMPDESVWEQFFDPSGALELLGLTPETPSAVDLGCGYGTFTIPAARIIRGTIHAFDIEPEMIRETAAKAEAAGLANVQLHLRDFAGEGTGLPDASIGYVMLFNILHAEEPDRILNEAHRILAPGGAAAVMHWVSERPTPRGPSMAIRPRPNDCLEWMTKAGFRTEEPVDLPPFHFGIVGRKD